MALIGIDLAGKPVELHQADLESAFLTIMDEGRLIDVETVDVIA